MEFALSPERIQALQDIGPQIELLEELVARAERAGLNVSVQRARLQQLKDLRNGILREFGPQNPIVRPRPVRRARA